MTSLAGGTLAALAAHPAVATVLRNAARGRQQAVYEGLHRPGPPVTLVEGHWLAGWGCAPEGCAARGLFLAFEAREERLFLMLLEDGVPSYLAPPRVRRWPAALAAPFAAFAPDLPRGPRFE